MVDFVITIAPFRWGEVFGAVLAGGILGTERQISGKPLGIRTSILICLSTYMFTRFCTAHPPFGEELNTSRIIGQIITGVGFLGGGAIIARGGVIRGLTSAASIWVMAAIGITVGLGHTGTGIKISLLAVLILTVIECIERRLPFMHKGG